MSVMFVCQWLAASPLCYMVVPLCTHANHRPHHHLCCASRRSAHRTMRGVAEGYAYDGITDDSSKCVEFQQEYFDKPMNVDLDSTYNDLIGVRMWPNPARPFPSAGYEMSLRGTSFKTRGTPGANGIIDVAFGTSMASNRLIVTMPGATPRPGGGGYNSPIAFNMSEIQILRSSTGELNQPVVCRNECACVCTRVRARVHAA